MKKFIVLALLLALTAPAFADQADQAERAQIAACQTVLRTTVYSLTTTPNASKLKQPKWNHDTWWNTMTSMAKDQAAEDKAILEYPCDIVNKYGNAKRDLFDIETGVVLELTADMQWRNGWAGRQVDFEINEAYTRAVARLLAH